MLRVFLTLTLFTFVICKPQQQQSKQTDLWRSDVDPLLAGPEEDFNKDPLVFLGQMNNPVTTAYLSDPTEPSLQNGGEHALKLLRLGDNSGYRLKNLASDPTDDPTEVKAVWLNTNDVITIKDGDGPILIATAELQSCSLYIKGNTIDNTVTIFHHNRVLDGNSDGNRKISCNETHGCHVVSPRGDEYYDDVFAFEDYFDIATEDILRADLMWCKQPEVGRNIVAATPFIYKKPGNNQWWFFAQIICHPLTVRDKLEYQVMYPKPVNWRLGKSSNFTF